MVEMFEGRCVDWNKFTAKDALAYTKEAQKDLQRQEYIDTIKEIAKSATLGQSDLTLNKKLTDYTVSRLETNAFNVTIEQIPCYTLTSGGSSIKNDYWTTTIKW